MAGLYTLHPSHPDAIYVSQQILETTQTQTNKKHIDIISVRSIDNPTLRYRYECKKMAIQQMVGPSREMLLCHGSPFCYDIANEGFNIAYSSPGCLFGRGIYLTPHFSKANYYAFGTHRGCYSHSNKACLSCVRTALFCHCILGHELHPVEPTFCDTKPDSGYNSIVADPYNNPSIQRFLQDPVYCILNADQVLPFIIVEYRIRSFYSMIPHPIPSRHFESYRPGYY